MTSILDIAEAELAAHGATRLTLACVRHGVLAGVVPDAMNMAFEALTKGTVHEGARLELAAEPLGLRCRACGHSFEAGAKEAIFQPCPACAAVAGYEVEKGDGIFLDHLEAE